MNSHPYGARIEGLQVLRALAALMVVAHHARSTVPGGEAFRFEFGAAGVDIFFVISGFVMAYTTRHLHGAEAFAQRAAQAGDFMRKRLVRIVPLYWIALLWTSRRELLQGRVSRDLLLDLAFVPHVNAEYPESLWPTLKQGWTLNYEMFFYGLFALTILAGSRRTIALLATLLVLVSLGWAFHTAAWPLQSPGSLSAPAVAGSFYTSDVLLEFGFGVLLHAALAKRRWAGPRAVYAAIAVASMAWLAWAFDEYELRGLKTGLPALLLVAASLHALDGVRLRALERLGDASYAIYLFHWASFGALKPVVTWCETQGWSGPLAAGALMLLHIACAALAGLTIHKGIERPLLRWGQAALSVKPSAAAVKAAA